MNTLIGLAAAGLVSAIFSAAARVSALGMLAPGAVFGLALVLYLAWFGPDSTRARFALFVCACSAAYPVAVISVMIGSEAFRHTQHASSELPDVPLLAFFAAGVIGACIVLLSGMLLFAEVAVRRWLLVITLVSSLAGGLLALLGVLLGSVVPGLGANAVTLTWQPGVALTLGALLDWTGRLAEDAPAAFPQSPPHPSVGLRVFAGVLFASVIAVVVFYVVGSIQVNFDERRINSLYQKLRDEQPPSTGLTAPEPVAPEVRCVPGDVGGQRFVGASPYAGAYAALRPPLARFASCLYSAEDRTAPARTRDTTAEVIQAPNADWARYEVKYATVELSSTCPRCITRPTKFGSSVVRIENESYYPLHYFWSSGTFFVLLTYDTTHNADEMLRLYLQKYPSDLHANEPQ